MLAELPHPAFPTPRIPSLPVAQPSPPTPSRCLSQRRPTTGWLLTLLLVLLSGAATRALAQTTPSPPPECAADEKFANTWYFGFKAGLDFNQATDSIPPTVLTNGAMDAPAGAGVMCDSNGKILFYSNGETVWNGDGTVMTNGTGLAGNRFNTDGPLPIKMPGLPMPGQPTRYLLFTLNSTVGLSYSEIDIPAGGGPGTVIPTTKNTPLARGTAEKLTGVFHKNGCEIWVIAHGWGTGTAPGFDNRGDAFLAYRVRLGTGVDTTPIVSAVGSLHAPSVAALGYKGQMKITPDGQRLALARYSEVVGDSSSTVELFAFDTGTGQVSVNPQVPYIVDKGEGKYYGVEFSAGSYLYATVMNPPKLLQFDISGNKPVSKQVIPLKQKAPANLGSLQAAVDGKIYVARDNQPALGFIAYPDSLGAKARYADDSLRLGGRLSGLGLVNFNQSSLLRVGFGAQSTGCLQITFTAPPIEFDPKTYAWDFGDGTTSAEANPVHTYASAQNYVVTLRITTNCFCRQVQSLVPVPGYPTPGSIGSPQTLCAGATAAPLTSTTPAGAGTGQYSYQWQSSADNSTWADIGGATAPSFAPGALSATRYFRRLVTSGFCGVRTPTTAVAITVLPVLVPGTIAADQTVCAGSTAAPLTGTAPATGGTGTFGYQWESSPDNTTWTAIAGATGEALTPGPLTATTYFRRQAISGPCATPSNVVTLTVTPALVAGTIGANQSICAGTTPTPLASTTDAGGGGGAITYQWESSPDNTTWAAIAGATGPTYAPGALSATTYFRRRVNSGTACAPAISNVVIITVTPALTAGSIAADQTVCAGTAPTPLTSLSDAGGGTGASTYQWESSPDNTTWTAIAGATGSSLAPGPLAATTYFRRRASAAGACAPAVSNVVTITVTPALTAGSIAADQALCAGTTPTPLTSTTDAGGGSGTIAYQWETSLDNSTWTAIAGATGSTYAPGPLNATTYFRRRASAGTACAPAVSNVVTITVTPPLAAGTIGTSQTLCAGAAPAPLTSTAAVSGGTGSYSYQWEFSPDNSTWTAVAGATSETLAPGPLAATTYFRRRVTSGLCGPVYSAPVTLTVLPALTAGSIAADQTVCAGDTPTPLTSVAGAGGGTGTFAYQWEYSPDNSTWADISGATSAGYAPGVLPATTYFRRRVTSGACGPAYSPVVAITVLPALTAGTITADQTLCAGATPTPLTSTSEAGGGSGVVTYQWEFSADNATWTAISGATGPAYAPGALTATTYFRRRANAGTCTPAVSNVVTITVPPALTAGTIAADQTVCAGTAPAPLTGTAGASGGTGSYNYQWESSPDNSTWTAVAGATGADYAPGPLAATTFFRRRVTSGACGPAYSAAVTLRVLPYLNPGSIAADQAICTGAAPTPLTSIADASGGSGIFAYQWESSADNNNWTAIAGANTSAFAPGALTATTYYRRRVTSGVGACSVGVSNVLTIQVQPFVTPTVSLDTPPVQCAGTPLTFTAVVANAGTAPTFRWLVNNVPVATGPTFTSSTLATGDQVRVEVTPTLGLCATGGAAATVTVTRTATTQPTLAIAVQPNAPVCPGELLTFSIANVTGAGPTPTYQWQVNGTDVAGATTPVFSSTTLRDGQTVTLRLRTTNECGLPVTAVSNSLGVRILPPVVVNAGPDKEILAGTSVTLEGTADGTYPVTWTPALGLTIPASDPLHPVASPLVTTTYTLSAGAGGCASSDQVTVTVHPAIRIPNAFTPNGDGHDDTWQIEFIEQYPDNTVTVFNRWGNKIFSAENYSRANEWRGDINGQPAPVGTYYYVVVTKGPLGKSYAGSITVLY